MIEMATYRPHQVLINRWAAIQERKKGRTPYDTFGTTVNSSYCFKEKTEAEERDQRHARRQKVDVSAEGILYR